MFLSDCCFMLPSVFNPYYHNSISCYLQCRSYNVIKENGVWLIFHLTPTLKNGHLIRELPVHHCPPLSLLCYFPVPIAVRSPDWSSFTLAINVPSLNSLWSQCPAKFTLPPFNLMVIPTLLFGSGCWTRTTQDSLNEGTRMRFLRPVGGYRRANHFRNHEMRQDAQYHRQSRWISKDFVKECGKRRWEQIL
jgi:hypothetical protein